MVKLTYMCIYFRSTYFHIIQQLPGIATFTCVINGIKVNICIVLQGG